MTASQHVGVADALVQLHSAYAARVLSLRSASMAAAERLVRSSLPVAEVSAEQMRAAMRSFYSVWVPTIDAYASQSSVVTTAYVEQAARVVAASRGVANAVGSVEPSGATTSTTPAEPPSITPADSMVEQTTRNATAGPVIEANRSEKAGFSWPQLTDRVVNRARGGAASMIVAVSHNAGVRAAKRSGAFASYMRVAQSGACGACMAMSGTFQSIPTVVEYHLHCVLGDTLVEGPAIGAHTRRQYEGPIVEIRTASGQFLSITPNHPVLTPRGWVPAGLLQEGDEVIRGSALDLLDEVVPYEQHGPASIEQVWSSAQVSPLVRVPGASQNFHGDVFDSEIEVVSAYGPLALELEAALDEEIAHSLFGAGHLDRMPSLVASSGGVRDDIFRLDVSTDGGMGWLDEGDSLCWRHALEAQTVGVAAIAGDDAYLGQAIAESRSADAEVLRHLEEGFASVVPDLEILDVDGKTPSPRFDPVTAQDDEDTADAYADLGRSLCGRLSGAVETDRVIFLNKRHFSGHVFNLETAEGWYSANEIIVSNCRCSLIFIPAGVNRDDFPDVPTPEARWAEMTIAEQDATYGAEAAKLVRDGDVPISALIDQGDQSGMTHQSSLERLQRIAAARKNAGISSIPLGAA